MSKLSGLQLFICGMVHVQDHSFVGPIDGLYPNFIREYPFL